MIEKLSARAELVASRRAVAVEALRVLATVIRKNPTTGQVGRLVTFLAGMYNGFNYPLNLSALKGVDDFLATACLAVLAFDVLGTEEVHTLGVFDGDELNSWIAREGITPANCR